jgi:hypothetical protein
VKSVYTYLEQVYLNGIEASKNGSESENARTADENNAG